MVDHRIGGYNYNIVSKIIQTLHQQRVALQITGGLRSFKSCIPTILKAVLFDENPERYDVFLLIDRQERENYSIENELTLRGMLRDRIKVLKYTNEFNEELYTRRDFHSILEYIKDEELYLDAFVYKLWIRRYIVNEPRLLYEK